MKTNLNVVRKNIRIKIIELLPIRRYEVRSCDLGTEKMVRG